MALTPGLVLDGASGFVLIAFGILALLVRPRQTALVAFAVFAFGTGVRAIWANLAAPSFPSVEEWAVAPPTYLVGAAGLLWFTWSTLGGAPRRETTAAAFLGVITPIAYFIGFLSGGAPPRVLLGSIAFGLLNAAFYASLALLALRAAREGDGPRQARHALLAFALVAYPLAFDGIFLMGLLGTGVTVESGWLGAALLFPPVVTTALWVRAAAKGARRAVWVALAIPAFMLLGEVLALALTFPVAFNSGVLGACRTLTVALVALAFARSGLLGGQLAIRRGTIATGLLAIVLIVAQVMQNFLEAQYGLLMGGVVAGAFLFMAAPLQRMIERGHAPALPAPVAAGEHDEAYRAAIRVALRDRRLTRDEEVALADVAERLGIGARRAAEIRHDVEQERGIA